MCSGKNTLLTPIINTRKKEITLKKRQEELTITDFFEARYQVLKKRDTSFCHLNSIHSFVLVPALMKIGAK